MKTFKEFITMLIFIVLVGVATSYALDWAFSALPNHRITVKFTIGL